MVEDRRTANFLSLGCRRVWSAERASIRQGSVRRPGMRHHPAGILRVEHRSSFMEGAQGNVTRVLSEGFGSF